MILIKIFAMQIMKQKKRILDIALDKISISSNRKNHIKLNTIFYNGKKFQKFYDKVSGLIFFYEIINNKYKLPSIDDITYLVGTTNTSLNVYVLQNNIVITKNQFSLAEIFGTTLQNDISLNTHTVTDTAVSFSVGVSYRNGGTGYCNYRLINYNIETI